MTTVGFFTGGSPFRVAVRRSAPARARAKCFFMREKVSRRDDLVGPELGTGGNGHGNAGLWTARVMVLARAARPYHLRGIDPRVELFGREEAELEGGLLEGQAFLVGRLRDRGRLVVPDAVSYTHLRAHETDSYLVC